MSKEEREETERLLLEELARRETQGATTTTTTTSSSSSLLLAGASGANKVVSATFSAFNETLNTILDTKRDQEEEDKFWESVPVLPLEEGEEEDEREYKEDVLLYTGEDDSFIINNNNSVREKNEQSEENVLLSEEKDEEDGGGRVGVGGNFVSDLLVNTYKQAQEAEEMLLRTKRESVLNELEYWTASTTAAAAATTTTTNRVLDFDDIGNEKNLNNNSNNNMNNNTNFSSAKMNADGQVGVTERYASYLAKVLPSGKRRNSQKKNNTFDFGPDNNDNDDDDDDDKQFEKVKSTFMSDAAQRELDKLEASFTPHRKSKKSFFRDFLQFGSKGSKNTQERTREGGSELLLDDPALLDAVSKEMSKIDKVLNDLKTDVAIKNLANVARNTGGGRLNSFADALDALARHPMWEYQIVRYAAMIALLALFTFGIYLKVSIESREEVGGLIDVGIQKSSAAGRKKFLGG
jgi:hypothetical protein